MQVSDGHDGLQTETSLDQYFDELWIQLTSTLRALISFTVECTVWYKDCLPEFKPSSWLVVRVNCDRQVATSSKSSWLTTVQKGMYVRLDRLEDIRSKSTSYCRHRMFYSSLDNFNFGPMHRVYESMRRNPDDKKRGCSVSEKDYRKRYAQGSADYQPFYPIPAL